MCLFLCPRSSLTLFGEVSAVQMITIIIITTIILYFVKNCSGTRGIAPAITVTIILFATRAEEHYVINIYYYFYYNYNIISCIFVTLRDVVCGDRKSAREKDINSHETQAPHRLGTHCGFCANIVNSTEKNKKILSQA